MIMVACHNWVLEVHLRKNLFTDLILIPSVIFGYLLKPSYAGKGWTFSLENLIDIICGHMWFGFIPISGGI